MENKRRLECPRCKGTGYYNLEKCLSCNNTGEIQAGDWWIGRVELSTDICAQFDGEYFIAVTDINAKTLIGFIPFYRMKTVIQ